MLRLATSPFAAYAVVWVGYVIGLAALPVLFPPDPTLPNAAARTGYSVQVAYFAVVGWTVLALLALSFVAWRRQSSMAGAPETTVDAVSPRPGRRAGWVECLVVAALTGLLYWPAFLARHGHYIEDNYFINVLLRMACGQEPFRDFEFLYGPLMVYPAAKWMTAFGYSLVSYYALLAIVEAAFFAVMLRVFQRHLPDRVERWIAFAVFVPFVFNANLGLNSSAVRLIAPVLALVAVAARPRDWRISVLAGGLIGIQLAFSYEYGLIGLIALLLVYGVLWAGKVKETTFASILLFGGTAVIVGVAVTWGVTGDTLGDYLGATKFALDRASRFGLGNFPFYWTLNSLALFGLLAIAVGTVGSGLRNCLTSRTSYGDRLLLGSVLIAIGALRFALQRADVWHLTKPFTALLLVFLWHPATTVFKLSAAMRRLVQILIVVAGVTRLIGILPEGSLLASGLAKGARDIATGVPPVGPIASRTTSIMSERSKADPDHIALAAALATPERANRPVIFYGDIWWKGSHLGVCPAGYSFYKLMYADGYQPIATFLTDNPTSMVVMDAETFAQLYRGDTVAAPSAPLSFTKRLGSWLSTIHYSQKALEEEIQRDIWRQNVGAYLIMHYRPALQTGTDVLLERR